jgi:hypothetical protein
LMRVAVGNYASQAIIFAPSGGRCGDQEVI